MSEVHEYGPLDVSAHYSGLHFAVTVYVYPADMLPGGGLDDHFDQALYAINQRLGVETAEQITFNAPDDPRARAYAALFELDQPPMVHGVVSVHEACSHVVKLRLSTDASVTQERQLEMLDIVLDEVLPRDFVIRAHSSFPEPECGVEINESQGQSYSSPDGCKVFWNPASGPLGLHDVLCEALDAKVARQGE